MAAHLGKVIAVLPMAEHEALEKSCELVEAEAKAEIGNYQGAAGPFAAWAPLAESTLDDKERKGFGVPDPLLRTGDMRDSIEHVVGGRSGFVGSDSDIAVYQEIGTAKIPPRSFLGHAAVTKEDDIHSVTGRLIFGALISGETRIALPRP